MANISKSKVYGVVVAFIVLLFVYFVIGQFELPAPTGPYKVGRSSRAWADNSRLEMIGPQQGKARELPVQIWYPAQAQTGIANPYFPQLSKLAKSLADSGEVAPINVFLLRFVRSHERADAAFVGDSQPHPVIILSPGNGTNVDFYSGIADELASHGFVVIGINHPYDVAATTLLDGSIAQFNPGPFEFPAHEAWVRERIQIRVEDVLFVFKQLEALNMGEDVQFAGRLDLSRVGVMGHSLGGITAAQACTRDNRFSACLNFDGIQRGGPFSATEDILPPSQPFMLITKEEQIAPAAAAIFAEIQGGSYRVVIRNASHDNFTDGPPLLPSLLPVPNRADNILTLVRVYTLAFFAQTLRANPSELIHSSFESTDIKLEVYPAH